MHNNPMPFTPRELREVFHLLFLRRLLDLAQPALFALKGGVNLRLFFNSRGCRRTWIST